MIVAVVIAQINSKKISGLERYSDSHGPGLCWYSTNWPAANVWVFTAQLVRALQC